MVHEQFHTVHILERQLPPVSALGNISDHLKPHGTIPNSCGHGIWQSHGSGLNELLYEVSGATHGGIEERGEAILQR